MANTKTAKQKAGECESLSDLIEWCLVQENALLATAYDEEQHDGGSGDGAFMKREGVRSVREKLEACRAGGLMLVP